MITRRVVVAWCAVVLGLAGCTKPSAESPEPPATTTAAHPKAEGPKDRDERAVRATLRRLDYCRLLATAAIDDPSDASGPFKCIGEFDPTGDLVSIETTRLDPNERLSLPARALGGAKAYVSDTGTGCVVHLPVSFRLALTIGHGLPCRQLEQIAAAVATTVADPASARVEPSWDPCDALRSVLDDLGLRSEVSAPEDGRLTSCQQDDRFRLWFSHQLDDRPTTDTIGDTGVWVDADDSRNSCVVSWSRGSLATGGEGVASVRAAECDQAKEVAGAAIAVLADPPPDLAPRQPLLYAPTEPDSPFPGACAYAQLGATSRCQPYVEVSVPDGRAAILDAAEADPNVECALAFDALAQHFGDRLTPVTTSAGECHFLEPARLIDVGINLLAHESVRDAVRFSSGGSMVKIAGHPGYQSRPGFEPRRFAVALTDDEDEDGTVVLTLGSGPVISGGGPTQADLDKAEPVLADIVRAHFG